ncbi:xylose isomerase, partial [Staphylococcus equorum]
VEGNTSFKELEEYAFNINEIDNTSDRLEVIKAQMNQYILNINNGD